MAEFSGSVKLQIIVCEKELEIYLVLVAHAYMLLHAFLNSKGIFFHSLFVS